MPDIEKVMKTIEGYDGVESVSFTTKDQALDNFRKSTSNPEIVDQLDGDNPRQHLSMFSLMMLRAYRTLHLRFWQTRISLTFAITQMIRLILCSTVRRR